MEDRIALYPGRVRMTPVAGQPDLFDMTMADQPTVEGTSLNKGNLLSDPTAALADAEYGETPDTPNEALALIAKGKVGTIVHSLSADMGENYALCNGDMYDPEEYPDFANIFPKNIFPKPNPGGVTVGGGVTEMHNGEFVSNVSSYSQYRVIGADGRIKGYVNLSDITTATAQITGIENNGSKYIVFVRTGNTTISVYSTTNLSTYTLEKQVTLTHNDSGAQPYIVEGDIAVSQKFDGTYYYYLRLVSGGRALAILNSSFTLLSDTAVLSSSAGTLALRICGNRAYAFLHDGNGTIGVKQISGTAPPTSMSGYRTVAWTNRYDDKLRLVEFNDSYDVMWQSGNFAFIPRNGTSAIASYSPFTSVAAVFLDGNAEKLIVGASGTTYAFCDTSAVDPTQASAWGTSQFAETPDYGQFYNNRWRHKESVMPYQMLILRAPLLPTITDDNAYVYAKIK